MKFRLIFAIGLIVLGAPAHARAPGAARNIPLARFVDLAPGQYSAAGISVKVRKTGRTLPRFTVTVAAAKKAAFRVVVDDHWAYGMLPKFGIGRLQKGAAPVVIIQSYSGGAHCCVTLRFVTPTRSSFEMAESKSWDGDFFEQWPKDIDGDGRADLVRNDGRFLYAFTAYAFSYSPPLILNIIGNRVQDVSTKAGFRQLFFKDMRRARAECLNSGGRGACAAYVADAARVGGFSAAWSEMLRSYDRNSNWGYPGNCDGNAMATDHCEAGKPRFRNYPDALLHFLRRTGYVAGYVRAPIN